MHGIEYDIYPYSESTRKQLRLLCSLGYRYSAYSDTTIYDELNENHFQHTIEAAYEVVQKWGSIDLRAEYRNYLHDWCLERRRPPRLGINLKMDLRFKGAA